MAAKKYFHTAETDDGVREAYRLLRQCKNHKAVLNLAKQLGWPKHALQERARQLGLARVKEKPWSAAEERILEDCGWMSAYRLVDRFKRAGFRRTVSGIESKRTEMRLRGSYDAWTLNQVAEALGVGQHTVTAWVTRGFLNVEPVNPETEEKGHRCATRTALRAFFLNHPDEIVLAKIPPAMTMWFLDIVSGGKLCEAWRREVA